MLVISASCVVALLQSRVLLVFSSDVSFPDLFLQCWALLRWDCGGHIWCWSKDMANIWVALQTWASSSVYIPQGPRWASLTYKGPIHFTVDTYVKLSDRKKWDSQKRKTTTNHISGVSLFTLLLLSVAITLDSCELPKSNSSNCPFVLVVKLALVSIRVNDTLTGPSAFM